MALEIRIDREKCMGSGNCSFWAPGSFDLDEEGISIVTDPEGHLLGTVHSTDLQ